MLFSGYRHKECTEIKITVRACSKNAIEMLSLVISSISGLLARPLVINLGFHKQETSGKFI